MPIVFVVNSMVTRWVLSETKAIMSPPVCHWMEANFFVEEGELILMFTLPSMFLTFVVCSRLLQCCAARPEHRHVAAGSSSHAGAVLEPTLSWGPRN